MQSIEYNNDNIMMFSNCKYSKDAEEIIKMSSNF